MSLTACLLTHNDEANLPRVLGSVRGVADEVVVADTGSTDRTVAVATELGARVCTVAWDDDFAAGRNAALGHATGDWILWLNPDEELLPAARERVPTYLAADVLAYALRVQEVPRRDRPDAFTETLQFRLFRRHPEVRYVGRLHPDFRVPLGEVAGGCRLGIAQAPDLVIRHHAYLSVLTEPKLRWALRLLERELADRPGQLDYQIEYGRTLLLLNDPQGHEILAEVAAAVLDRRDDPRPPSAAVGSLLEYLLTVSAEQSRSRVTRAEACELALRWFPQTPPMLFRVAEHDFQTGNLTRAAEVLERLVRCGQTGVYDRSAAFDPEIMGRLAVQNLAACYTKLGNLERAAYYGQLLRRMNS